MQGQSNYGSTLVDSILAIFDCSTFDSDSDVGTRVSSGKTARDGVPLAQISSRRGLRCNSVVKPIVMFFEFEFSVVSTIEDASTNASGALCGGTALL